MKPRAIVDSAKDGGLFSDKLSGKTPHQTMKAKISVDIRTKGVRSRFVRTAPNTFYLRELVSDPSAIYEASRQTLPSAGEMVITFPSFVLDSVGRFQGISRKWRPLLERTLNDRVCEAVNRLDAEEQDERKQLVTYILVTRGRDLLCFRRGSFNRVEDYLRGSLCIGFGGHVSIADVTLFNRGRFRQIIYDNAARELFEELRLPDTDKSRIGSGQGMQIVGVLNDDSSPTGRKHMAVVLRYEASDSPLWDRPSRGEKSITQLSWLHLDDFDHDLREFEYWSQLCLTELFCEAVRMQPSFVIRRRTPFRQPHVLCIVGGIGSGKSVATRILKTEFGYKEVNSGKVLAELIGIPPVPRTSRDEFQIRAWRFINQRLGPAKLAKTIVRRASEVNDPILIDGIRQRATLEEVRKQVAPRRLAILFVHTPPHLAYEFYTDRSGRKINLHDFLALCDASVEAEVKKMISVADAVLYNWTGKLKYEQAVRQLMRELKR
jgi:predicted NUDIX family phosphoesterase/dephospho-CoA kinase